MEDADWPASTPSLARVDLDDLAASASCAGIPGTLTMEGMLNLRAMDLSGWNLRAVRANRADLSGASLVAAVGKDADLDGARLRGADLSGASLRGAVLLRSDLRGCICRRAPAWHPALTRLSHRFLGEAKFLGLATDLLGAKLQGADLRGGDFEGSLLLGANLTGARMDECRLTGCDLTGTLLRATVLDRATVRNCRMFATSMDKCRTAGATLRRNRYPAFGGLFALGLLLGRSRSANLAEIKGWPPEIRADFRCGGTPLRRLVLHALGV
jgi:uncharacterized protein YjbI with pentapeptide repeats